MALRAVVIGAGWAGEGHTIALRAAGVEVVAMCGRTPESAYAMAKKLGIENVRFDWCKALEEFKPDIVAIATPAGPHREMAKAAAELGCHIMCDKPLATSAEEARYMLLAVERAGVKHAYGTTSRYAPAVVYTRTLLAKGFIGQVREIESIVHFYFSPLLPYHWFHQLSQGGGMLNNLFTHKLGQVLSITDGKLLSASGESRRLIDRAPVGPTLHDFRDLFKPGATIAPEQANSGKWREVDADMGYAVMTELKMPDGQTASALFQASAMATSQHPDYLAFYGAKGTLHLTGPNAPDRIQHFSQESQKWEDIPVPREVVESLPQIEDPVQRDWNQLFREFVADVRGEGYAGYPTFRDGWMACEIVEIARSNRGWTLLPENPAGLSRNTTDSNTYKA